MLRKLGISLGLLILPIAVYSAEVSLPMVSLDNEPVSARSLFGEVPDELISKNGDLYGIPDPVLQDEEDLAQFDNDSSFGKIEENFKSDIAKIEKKSEDVAERKINPRNPEKLATLKPKKLSSNVWFRENDNSEIVTSVPKVKNELEMVAVKSESKIEAPKNTVSKQELLDFATDLKKELENVKEKLAQNNSVKSTSIYDSDGYFSNDDTKNNLVSSLDTVPELAKQSMAFQIPEKIKEKPVEEVTENKVKKIAEVKDVRQKEFSDDKSVEFAKLSPSDLKKEFYKTYVSENEHLSAYADFDTESNIGDLGDEIYRSVVSGSELEDEDSDAQVLQQVKPLEIKIGFQDEDSALSRDNYRLLSMYAAMIANNPRKAIQISLSERVAKSYNSRKLAAKRLSIVEQVLKDSGVSEKRIIPVLSSRNDDAFVLRIISMDQYKTLIEKKRDMFGDETITKKSGRSLSW